MSSKDRTYDVVVFGATGLAGSQVTEELLQARDAEKKRVAVAGRSRARLEGLLGELGAAGRFGVIVADVEDPTSLLRMAKAARLVLACVGPYRLYGEAVVAACVEAATDYLDVCGEPDFIERMEYKYGLQAAEQGCYLVSAAGIDCIPAEVGVLHTAQRFASPSAPSLVESYLTVTSTSGLTVGYGTWASLVLGVGATTQLRALRREIIRANRRPPPPRLLGPRPTPRPAASWDSRLGAYILPFPGADASVVKRTQACLGAKGKQAVHYAAYFTVPSWWYLMLLLMFGTIFSQLAKYAWGRSLLLRYPEVFSCGLFSRRGPSHQQLADTKFCMTFVGRGYSEGPPSSTTIAPDSEVVTRLSGPEPGYIATAGMMVATALHLQAQRSHLQTPGAYTIGTLFADSLSKYKERLASARIKIEDL